MKSILTFLAALLLVVCGTVFAKPVTPPPGWTVIMLKNPVWLTGISEKRDGKLIAVYSADFPPPVTTEHFAMFRAGYWLANQQLPTEVIYRFLIDVRQSYDKRVYTRSIVDNPSDVAKPIKYEHYLDPKEKSTTTTHVGLSNVERGKHYTYVFEAYEDENRTILLERLTQEIVSPLDNVSGCVQLEPAIMREVFPGAEKGTPAPIDKIMLACDR